MTEKEVAQKLRTDPVFFIEHFLWVVDKDRKRVPFHLNEAQKAYYQNRSRNDLILKARKEGFSTLIEALFLHSCIFGQNVNAVTMSHTWDDTVIHLDRVKYFLDTMEAGGIKFTVPLDKENQRELFFPESNSRYWIGTAGSQAFGRGRDITHLHLSEAAFYTEQRVVTGVMEACVPSAYKAIETTANGVGDLFHTLWEASKKDPASPWKRHFFAWWQDGTLVADKAPGDGEFTAEETKIKDAYKLTDRQVYWHRHKKAEMIDPSLMPQEYPSNDREAFLVSGACIFDKDGMEIQERKVEKPDWVGMLRDTGYSPEFVLDDNGPLRVFRQPETNQKYLISADAAKGGIKGDRSVAVVWNRYTKTVAALWYGRTDPSDFGKVLFGLGLHYNTAKIAVEGWPGPGIATVAKLVEMGYRKLFKRFAWDGEKRTDTTDVGWVTDERSRYDMLATLQDAIKNKWAILRAQEIVDECYNFVRKDNGRPEARAGCHDDCVVAAAIGLHCMKFDPVEEMLGTKEMDGPLVVSQLVGRAFKGGHGPKWRAAHASAR